MGLGKQKAKLDGELFRRTEPQALLESSLLQPAVVAPEEKNAKMAKERFSLYLEPALAKRLRLYAVQHDIKNINGLLAQLIGRFLDEQDA